MDCSQTPEIVEVSMPMKPAKDESKSDFMARCVSEMSGANGGTKRPQDQAVAACLTMWGDSTKSKSGDGDSIDTEPDDDETREEFMQRCLDETDGDQFACSVAWDNRKAKQVVHKTHVSETGGLEFVLSDATPDRMGDVIEADGWNLENFKKNPIALFNHRSDFPIGKWVNLRTAGDKLLGHLQLAKKGTSERINEIISLVEQGILRTVSVGFLPIQS